MRITITEDEKNQVWDFLKTNNIANRGVADGSRIEQYIGLLGEMKAHQLFKIPFEFSKGFDGGYDMEINGLKADVKTMGRNVDMKPDYVHNFNGLQKHFERAKKFKKGSKRYRDDGTYTTFKCTTYEIKNKDLNPIKDLM